MLNKPQASVNGLLSGHAPLLSFSINSYRGGGRADKYGKDGIYHL
jgi:hypothetical protein